MSKRDHDLNQLKEFANEIAWLEAKLIQQRESKEEKKISKSTREEKSKIKQFEYENFTIKSKFL